jgi:7-cyano-7-deazaguanine synthase
LKAILLSGGIDSACIAYWKKPELAIHLNYGQRPAEAELNASWAIAESLHMEFITVDIDCSSLGSGDLTNSKPLAIAPVSEWWPFRNQLLMTLASMKAVTLGVEELFFGAVSTDNRHIDGTPIFFKKIAQLTRLQEGQLKISTPAIQYTTEQLVQKSKVPLSLLGWTHSCHTSNLPCGKCNGCFKHLNTKQKFGIL